MSNRKIHTATPEMRPVSLAEYRENQEVTSGEVRFCHYNSAITEMQQLSKQGVIFSRLALVFS